jgi:hypothetical protein
MEEMIAVVKENSENNPPASQKEGSLTGASDKSMRQKETHHKQHSH